MRLTDYHWWMETGAGQIARVAVGVVIFVGLALWDYDKNGPRATRWREYVVLLACVLAAMLYGAINDQITTTISWEYFAYGKGVAERVPADEPPNSPGFRWEAAKIGMQATWTPGLIIGVALLVANNPFRGTPRLRYRRLLQFVPLILIVTAITSAVLAAAGYLGAFVHFNTDFHEMVADDQWRPKRFMAVYGEHLGGYVGGLLGTVVAVARIVRERRKQRNAPGGSPVASQAPL
jgi:hypothetical protein